MYYSSDGKVSWLLGAKEYQKVTQNKKPHPRDLLGGKNQGAASAWVINNGELSRRWALYRVSWGGGGTFQGEASQGRD